VHPDETVWTIEDNKLLNIMLAKADVALKDEIWESLLEGDMYKPDPFTLHEMRKKMDLERFQIEVSLAGTVYSSTDCTFLILFYIGILSRQNQNSMLMG
jgi:hypothetical protein